MENHPISQEKRIRLLDSIRGFAVFGILLMNIPFFAHSYHIHYNINVMGEYSGPNYWCWKIVNLFFEGTMRGLFSLLFGAGAVLLLDRLEKNPPEGLQAADIYYRRLIWLLIFGLVNAFIFLWPGDILYCYSLVGLFLFPFRKWPPLRHTAFAGIFLAISIFQASTKMWEAQSTRNLGIAAQTKIEKNEHLNEEENSALESWKKYQENHSIPVLREKVKGSIEEMKGSYGEIFSIMKEVNFKLETKEMYHEYFFDALAFFFLGMALLHWGFFSGQRPWKHLAVLSITGYSIGLTINYFWMKTMVLNNFDLGLVADQLGFSFYQLKRLGLTLGHLGLLLWMGQAGILGFLFRWMANVGQMAFTNYLMQSIFGALVFHGYGFAQFGQWERFQWYEYVAIVWLFQLIFSQIWMHYFRFGPFEWLWRSLTWWKRQPFLR